LFWGSAGGTAEQFAEKICGTIHRSGKPLRHPKADFKADFFSKL
jgi:hypothetical protein